MKCLLPILTAVLALMLTACDGGLAPEADPFEATASVDDAAFGKDHKVLVCHDGVSTSDGDGTECPVEGCAPPSINLISIPIGNSLDKHLAHGTDPGDCICADEAPEGYSAEDLCPSAYSCDSALDEGGEVGVADGCEGEPVECFVITDASQCGALGETVTFPFPDACDNIAFTNFGISCFDICGADVNAGSPGAHREFDDEEVWCTLWPT